MSITNQGEPSFWRNPLAYIFAGDILIPNRERQLRNQVILDEKYSRQLAESEQAKENLDAYVKAGGNPYNFGNGMLQVFANDDAGLTKEAKQAFVENTKRVTETIRQVGDSAISSVFKAVPIWIWIIGGIAVAFVIFNKIYK
jgi:hypothetical protein